LTFFRIARIAPTGYKSRIPLEVRGIGGAPATLVSNAARRDRRDRACLVAGIPTRRVHSGVDEDSCSCWRCSASLGSRGFAEELARQRPPVATDALIVDARNAGALLQQLSSHPVTGVVRVTGRLVRRLEGRASCWTGTTTFPSSVTSHPPRDGGSLSARPFLLTARALLYSRVSIMRARALLPCPRRRSRQPGCSAIRVSRRTNIAWRNRCRRHRPQRRDPPHTLPRLDISSPTCRPEDWPECFDLHRPTCAIPVTLRERHPRVPTADWPERGPWPRGEVHDPGLTI